MKKRMKSSFCIVCFSLAMLSITLYIAESEQIAREKVVLPYFGMRTTNDIGSETTRREFTPEMAREGWDTIFLPYETDSNIQSITIP